MALPFIEIYTTILRAILQNSTLTSILKQQEIAEFLNINTIFERKLICLAKKKELLSITFFILGFKNSTMPSSIITITKNQKQSGENTWLLNYPHYLMKKLP